MKFSKLKKDFVIIFVFLINSLIVSAQDERAQVPNLLQKAYFEVNAGSINYPFGASSMEPGYSFVSAEVPHPSVRLVLFGYEFNKNLAAQITYMRPVLWVRYKYDTEKSGTVWMNVGGLTLKPTLPIGNNFSIYGECGLGIITRNGIEYEDNNRVRQIVVSDMSYPTFLYGAGVKYHINEHWALQLCSNYSPANTKNKQPYTSFVGAGFTYKYGKFTDKQLQKTAETGYKYPKQWLQIGYSNNSLGYGINNALAKACLFWGGEAEVRQGLSLNYQRNVFHGAKIFALDWGVNTSVWQTNINKESFFTLSVFPVFRLNYLHSKPVDAYFYYSVAGPTYISKVIIEGHNTGGHFTFQDTMGTGIFFGDKRNYNAELKIGHYSNGNTYPNNDAVKIPLSLNVGYTF